MSALCVVYFIGICITGFILSGRHFFFLTSESGLEIDFVIVDCLRLSSYESTFYQTYFILCILFCKVLLLWRRFRTQTVVGGIEPSTLEVLLHVSSDMC